MTLRLFKTLYIPMRKGFLYLMAIMEWITSSSNGSGARLSMSVFICMPGAAEVRPKPGLASGSTFTTRNDRTQAMKA